MEAPFANLAHLDILLACTGIWNYAPLPIENGLRWTGKIGGNVLCG